MKKIFVIIMVIVMAFAFAACGQKDEGPAAGTALSAFYDGVIAAQAEDAEDLIFFEESDPALIESFYPGLMDIELSQQVFYMPPIATAPCEIVIVEVADSGDVQAVKDIFNARIELGASDTTYPESAMGWQNLAQVQASGNFVCMIVLPASHVIPENVFELN